MANLRLAGAFIYDGYRTDNIVRTRYNSGMPRYSFTLGEDIPPIDWDGTEDLANNQAAMEVALLICKDLARSKAAHLDLHLVVSNEAGDVIGTVRLKNESRLTRGRLS